MLKSKLLKTAFASILCASLLSACAGGNDFDWDPKDAAAVERSSQTGQNPDSFTALADVEINYAEFVSPISVFGSASNDNQFFVSGGKRIYALDGNEKILWQKETTGTLSPIAATNNMVGWVELEKNTTNRVLRLAQPDSGNVVKTVNLGTQGSTALSSTGDILVSVQTNPSSQNSVVSGWRDGELVYEETFAGVISGVEQKYDTILLSAPVGDNTGADVFYIVDVIKGETLLKQTYDEQFTSPVVGVDANTLWWLKNDGSWVSMNRKTKETKPVAVTNVTGQGTVWGYKNGQWVGLSDMNLDKTITDLSPYARVLNFNDTKQLWADEGSLWPYYIVESTSGSINQRLYDTGKDIFGTSAMSKDKAAVVACVSTDVNICVSVGLNTWNIQ